MLNNYKELIVDPKLVYDQSVKIKELSNEQVLKDIFFSRKDYEVFHVQMSNQSHLQEFKADKQYNFFFESVRMAYQYHIPLILSPEILWVAIIQGFSIHINENSEHFRKKIVDFDGKKKLVVQRDETDLRKLDWDNIFTNFTDLIRENIGTTLHSNLIQKFSGSTPLFQTVQEIQMMDTFQNYFEYVLMCGCGLPKVKLLGTLDDWVKLKEAALRLKEFELDWWIDRLVPILDKLISEYQANEGDKVFWNDIFLYRQGGASYGPSLANGWLTLFFPYLETKGYGGNGQSKFVKQEFVYGKPFNPEKDQFSENALNPDHIPSGLSQAPILYINLLTGESFDLTASSGYLKITKDKDGYLKPELGWFVRKGSKLAKTNR